MTPWHRSRRRRHRTRPGSPASGWRRSRAHRSSVRRAPSSAIARTLSGNSCRVHAAEAGAVGEAEVAELVVADGFPDAVHVTSCVDRAEVRQLVAVLLLAGVREALIERVELVDLIGLGHGIERRVDVLLLVAHADERVALTDAARIEAHEIEALGDRRIDDRRELGEELDARAAGSAGVDEAANRCGCSARLPSCGSGRVRACRPTGRRSRAGPRGSRSRSGGRCRTAPS